MDITFGFIALFISIIIPGLIFQRIFYYGEFSKQFTTKDPLIKSLVYSIIPGLIIQSLCLYVYVSFLDDGFELSDAISIHQNLLSSEGNLSRQTSTFLNNHFGDFLLYSFIVFGISALFGYLASRLIRVTGIDRRYKLFRFKNQWFYIFSGELFELVKFKRAVNILNSRSIDKNNVDMVFADVLVNTANGTQLYTGYVVDYDLDSENINDLDKIYLLEAHRYRREELKSSESNILHPMRTTKKSIPGSVFILPVKDLVNINIYYLTSKKDRGKSKEIKKKRSRELFESGSSIFTLIMLIFSIFMIKDADWIDIKVYRSYMENSTGFDKFIGYLLYFQLLILFVPKKSPDGLRSYRQNLDKKLIGLLVTAVVFFAFNFKWILELFGKAF